jgi:phosphatidylethanolamine/phosphatidyl-N-methylethanolamine N-methyltransferase
MMKPAGGQLERSGFLREPYASDEFVFLRAWMRAPLVTAAMLPSGRALARAVAAAVDPATLGAIVELGPGTGAVTAALVERGIEPDRLILIEFLPEFCDLLHRRYPAARVVKGDAFDAPSLLRHLSVGPLAAVVSGLPLYSKKPERRERLLHDMLRLGPIGTPFVQATNFSRSPIPFDPEDIVGAPSPRVWFNLLPALVWTYRWRQVPRSLRRAHRGSV